MSNFGGTWPKWFVFYAVDMTTVKSCVGPDYEGWISQYYISQYYVTDFHPGHQAPMSPAATPVRAVPATPVKPLLRATTSLHQPALRLAC